MDHTHLRSEVTRLFQTRLTHLYPDREINNIIRIYLLDKLPKLLAKADPMRLILNDIDELSQGKPIQYITSISWFYGIPLFVDENVLIPRPETEELVHWIQEEIDPNSSLHILDIGTGSGCIPLALKHLRPKSRIVGWDISPEAIRIAKKNGESLSLDVSFEVIDIQSDKNIGQASKFDIIISNPPYIPYEEKEQMTASTIKHEPKLALFVPNSDPLLYYRVIAIRALSLLRPDGCLYFEINEFRARETVELLTRIGYTDIILKKDLQGKYRMIQCRPLL